MKKKAMWWIIGLVVVIIVVAVIGWGAGTAKAPEVKSTAPTGTTQTAPAGSPSGMNSSTVSASASGTPGMTITFNGAYSNSAFSLTYPNGWQIISFGPTFSLTTFGNAYVDGDVIPSGGAEIDIATTTVYNNLGTIMQTELLSATNVTTTAVTVDDTACAEASYNNTYTGGIASQDIAVYCEQGTELWKMYLSYRENDPDGSAHIAAFKSVLASMKLL